MRSLLLSLTTKLVIILTTTCVNAETFSGRAEVTDGDTIIINDTRIRLSGVDAPEIKQTCTTKEHQSYPCGIQARDFLRDLTEGKIVTCEGDRVDRYGRYLMVCSTQDKNLNEAMIDAGWALAYTSYSRRYVEQERRARDNARGLWAGTFMPPWNWRRLKVQ